MALEGFVSEDFIRGELGSIRDWAFWTRELKENMVLPYDLERCVSGFAGSRRLCTLYVYHLQVLQTAVAVDHGRQTPGNYSMLRGLDHVSFMYHT